MLKNIIENEEILKTLSRENLLSLIKLLSNYKNKTIIEMIDEEISTLKEDILIEISNMRINNLKSQLFKVKYISNHDMRFYKIYKYEKYIDIYLKGNETDMKIILEDLKKDIKIKDYERIICSAKLSKISQTVDMRDHIKNTDTQDSEKELWETLEKKIQKYKKIENIKIKIFYKIEDAPELDEKKSTHYVCKKK